MFNLTQHLFTRQKFLQAETLVKQGEYEEAIKAFNMIKSNNMSYQTAQLSKAVCLFCLERFEEAIRIYDSVPLHNKCFSEAQFCKGKTLFTIEKYEEAIEAFNNVQVDHPLYQESQFYKGKSLVMVRNYKDAIEVLNHAKEDLPEVEILKGACLLMQQKYNLSQITVQDFVTKSDVYKPSELIGETYENIDIMD